MTKPTRPITGPKIEREVLLKTLQTFLPLTAARLCFNQRIKPPPAFQTLKGHFYKLAARVELRSAGCQKKIDVECEVKRKKLGDIM